MRISTKDYTKNNTYLQETLTVEESIKRLKRDWSATVKLLKDAQVKKDKLNYYIYFLVTQNNHTLDDIGEMVGIKPQHLFQIFNQVKYNLSKRGGDTK